MASTFLPELHAGTPTVSICDNRGLAVCELAWYRTAVNGSTDTRITRHQYNIHGQLVQSIDPRLYAARQLDNKIKPNFSWHYDLASSPLRTESVDAGRTISLSDIEGRPLLAVTAMDVIQRWQYEDDMLPGRPLAASELKPGQVTPSITERFIWAGNTQTEKDHNLVGQCVRHYDTAGLNRLDSLSLTEATLSQSRQLLADDQEAHWEGSSEDTWQAMLAEKVYLTQSTTDATGAPLTQTDAMGNRQRLAYDVAGQLMGSWLTLAGEDEQVIVKSLTYSAIGQKLCEEHGNGVVTEYNYEPQTQRLTGITTRRPSGHPAGAKLLQDLRYEYDPVGNVISLHNEAEESRFWRNQKVAPENTYTYDTLYQLTRATGREMANSRQQDSQLPALMAPLPADNSVYTNYTRTYMYDLGGSLSQIQHCAPATPNNYNTKITVSDRSNRAVLSQPGLTPDGVDALFDAGGHQKSLLPGQPLTWNSRGELQQVAPVNREEGASDQERYRYGGDGMRVLKISERQTRNAMQIRRVTYLPGLELRTTHNGTTTTEGLHVLTVGEAGSAQVRVLHWEGTPPSGISNNQVRYSYDNLIGSSGLELDGRGEIISQEEYYPYGGTAVWMVRSQIEADYKTVRYSGKERDATGLYYYGYRYYQPWVGRWLNPDPAGTIDGLNLYRMVKNNPITLSDSNGLTGKRKAGAGAGSPRVKKAKKALPFSDATHDRLKASSSELKNNDASYARSGKEQKRLTALSGINATTNKPNLTVSGDTHEAEHPIGYTVLAEGLPRKESAIARKIENFALAYQEVREAHRDHIGTGSRAAAPAYRSQLAEALKNYDVGEALYINQREYRTTFDQANQAAVARGGGLSLDFTLADNSFDYMLQKTEKVAFLTIPSTDPDTASLTAIDLGITAKFDAMSGRKFAKTGEEVQYSDAKEFLERLGNPAPPRTMPSLSLEPAPWAQQWEADYYFLDPLVGMKYPG
ncbi:hypothetical protein CPC16_006321 [Podila verticillata]|nr:hypothetical protein CPC16_006321 [Podila verticillata]